MGSPTNSRSPETSDDPRKLGKWVRVYAQNRSLGFVVWLMVFVVLYLMMGGLPILATLGLSRVNNGFLLGFAWS